MSKVLRPRPWHTARWAGPSTISIRSPSVGSRVDQHQRNSCESRPDASGTSDAVRQRLAGGNGPYATYQSPVLVRIDSFDDDEATVTLWLVSVVMRRGIAEPQSTWTTVSLTLSWERDDWRLASERSIDGPTPDQSVDEAPISVEEFEQRPGCAAMGAAMIPNPLTSSRIPPRAAWDKVVAGIGQWVLGAITAVLSGIVNFLQTSASRRHGRGSRGRFAACNRPQPAGVLMVSFLWLASSRPCGERRVGHDPASRRRRSPGDCPDGRDHHRSTSFSTSPTHSTEVLGGSGTVAVQFLSGFGHATDTYERRLRIGSRRLIIDLRCADLIGCSSEHR